MATQPISEPIRGVNAFTLGMLRGLKEGNHPHDPKKVNTVVWLKKWLGPINEVVLAELKKMREGKDDSFLGPIKDQDGKAVIAAGQRAIDKDLLT